MPVRDDYAHPSLVEAGKDANGNRHLVAVADEKGIERLRQTGHLTEAQYDAITKQLPVPSDVAAEDMKYILVFEGPDAGHLQATRAFNGHMQTSTVHLPVDPFGGNPATTYEVKVITPHKTLNLGIENPLPQAIDDIIGSDGLQLRVNNRYGAPYKDEAKKFLDEVKKQDFAQHALAPDMDRALAQANDPEYHPSRDDNSGLPRRYNNRQNEVV